MSPETPKEFVRSVPGWVAREKGERPYEEGYTGDPSEGVENVKRGYIVRFPTGVPMGTISTLRAKTRIVRDKGSDEKKNVSRIVVDYMYGK